MITAFLKRLRAPFPEPHSLSKRVTSMVSIGVFVALFLYFIRPFGLHRIEHGLFLICSTYGLITIVFGGSYQWFCYAVLKIRSDLPSWTLGKWVLLQMMSLAWIAVGNFLYISWSNENVYLTFGSIFEVLRVTVLVGVFPVFFSGLMVQLNADKHYQQQANAIHLNAAQDAQSMAGLQGQNIVTFALGPSEEIRLSSDDVLYVQAMQNYVTLVYLAGGKPQTTLLRNTIANTEAELAGNGSIMRCHRSYLVNLDLVAGVSGNAQGLKLALKQVEGVEIPVSRRYISAIKARMS